MGLFLYEYQFSRKMQKNVTLTRQKHTNLINISVQIQINLIGGRDGLGIRTSGYYAVDQGSDTRRRVY